VVLASRRSELGGRPARLPPPCGWSPGATSSCSGTGVPPEPIAYVLINAVLHSGVYTWIGL